jgi:hypothetical protein
MVMTVTMAASEAKAKTLPIGVAAGGAPVAACGQRVGFAGAEAR